jgi:hypothetical protein
MPARAECPVFPRPEIAGSRKLAQYEPGGGPAGRAARQTLIETRGEGG